MANLVRIFGSLVTDDYEKIGDIDVVAFDIMGTLVDRHGKIKPDMLRLFYYVAGQKDFETVFVSTHPAISERALLEAGCKHRVFEAGIKIKREFYERAVANQKTVLAIDDEPAQSAGATLCFDPNHPDFISFLQTRRYLTLSQPHFGETVAQQPQHI